MTTIEIQKFCSTHDVREYCLAPFNQDGWTIATNGHVLVAIPESDDFAKNPGPGKNSATKLLELDFVHDWRPGPDFDIPADAGFKDCPTCAGRGKCEITDCPECNGKGEVEWDSGYHTYEDDCLSCLGSGEVGVESDDVDCFDCNGSGKVVDIYDNIPVLGIPFQPQYVRLINNHPGLEVALSADKAKGIIFRQIIGGKQVARGAMMGLSL